MAPRPVAGMAVASHRLQPRCRVLMSLHRAGPAAGAWPSRRSARRASRQHPGGLYIGGAAQERRRCSTFTCSSADTPWPEGFEGTESHVHFGAGRLGLGLVIPALEQRHVPYAILQRPSKAWAKLVAAKNDNVTIMVNGEAVSRPIKILTDSEISDSDDLDPADLFVCRTDDQACGHLVLSNNVVAWDKLISNATSFSTSVGSSVADWVAFLLSSLPQRPLEERPVLYACENDSEAVKDLALQLEGCVEVVPCMVDRICAGRTVQGDPEPQVCVEAEEYPGSIVLLDQPAGGEDVVPLAGDTVTVPSSATEGAYLYHRKLVMVNGMHTTLAFLTMVYNEMQRNTGDPGEVAGYILEDLTLQTYDTAPEETRADIWCWAVAQVLKLMFENDEADMRSAHGVSTNQELVDDFLAIARTNQKRFASLDDTTARVLGGGVANRYMGRLVPVQEAVHAVQMSEVAWDPNHPMKLLLTTAGLELDDVVMACDKLVGRAWRYCRRDEVLQEYQETGEILFTPEAEGKMDQRERITKASMDLLVDTIKQQRILLDEVSEGVQQGPTSLLSDKVVVLFDFDGTLADTEMVAMDVNYWTLVPYMPNIDAVDLTSAARDAFMAENAGKNFGSLLAQVEADRVAAGLPAIAEAREAQAEDPAVLRRVDRSRTRLGLRTHADMRNEEVFGEEASIQEQQRQDTLLALGKLSLPNDHVKDVLRNLSYLGMPFAIATTNGRPRVPLALKAAGLLKYFGSDKIYCAESDFEEPRFKPDPSVYLLAAEEQGATPDNCIAVEDSGTGIGAAANAGIGLIVGFVGSSHIREELEHSHALGLLSGSKSQSGRGADIVISDFDSLLALVSFFRNLQDRSRPFSFPDALVNQMAGRVWLPADYEAAREEAAPAPQPLGAQAA